MALEYYVETSKRCHDACEKLRATATQAHEELPRVRARRGPFRSAARKPEAERYEGDWTPK